VLRREILTARDALPEDWRADASRIAVGELAALAGFREAGAVLLTLPFGSEIDVRPLALAALGEGKALLLPRVNAATRMLELFRVRDLSADIVAGPWNIPEPRQDCRRADPRDVEWVLVPGVAFDAACGRLGYGGGFYDRLLPLIDAQVPRIAAAFEMQMVPQVPRGTHDLAVDCIITHNRRHQRQREAT
jgi:5-formyltetrahydrofolate cyclo-ligase